MTILKLPGLQTQNAGCVQVAGKCSDGSWWKIAVRLAPQRGGFGFIVPQESPDFSVTMADFALETPFWRIVAEKEPCFSVTMINK